jgi:hypothetical protein
MGYANEELGNFVFTISAFPDLRKYPPIEAETTVPQGISRL